MALRPDMSGLIVQEPGHREIYWVDDIGRRCYIRDPVVYHRVFGAWAIAETTEVPNIDPGRDVDDDTYLIRGDSGRCYLYIYHTSRYITTPAVMGKYHLTGQLSQIPDAIISSIPTGPALDH